MTFPPPRTPPASLSPLCRRPSRRSPCGQHHQRYTRGPARHDYRGPGSLCVCHQPATQVRFLRFLIDGIHLVWDGMEGVELAAVTGWKGSIGAPMGEGTVSIFVVCIVSSDVNLPNLSGSCHLCRRADVKKKVGNVSANFVADVQGKMQEEQEKQVTSGGWGRGGRTAWTFAGQDAGGALQIAWKSADLMAWLPSMYTFSPSASPAPLSSCPQLWTA